jgi:hypothetical protein
MKSIRTLFYSLTGALLICFGTFAGSAEAQTVTNSTVCAAHATIVERLSDEYAETKVGTGLASAGYLVEVFASSSGSWTIVLTQPGGTACLIASGNYWESAPQLVGAAGA